LSNNQRITLDSWVQAKRELAGAADPSSDLENSGDIIPLMGNSGDIIPLMALTCR